MIENFHIEELDSLFIEINEEEGGEEAFFIFENSLKLLCRYLRKLN